MPLYGCGVSFCAASKASRRARIFLKVSANVSVVTMPAVMSATPSAVKMPPVPKNSGNMNVSGMRRMTLRSSASDMEIAAWFKAKKAFCNANCEQKKIEPAINIGM